MRMFILLVMVILTLQGPALAMERFDVVTTRELKQLLAERAEGKIDFLLVNGLDETIFLHSAIPGSINVPWPRVAEVGKERLGNDKDRLIITY